MKIGIDFQTAAILAGLCMFPPGTAAAASQAEAADILFLIDNSPSMWANNGFVDLFGDTLYLHPTEFPRPETAGLISYKVVDDL